MVVHGHVEQRIPGEARGGIGRVLGPREAMAVGVLLCVLLEDGEALRGPARRGRPLHVDVAHVGVVGGIRVDAVFGVGRGAIAVIVVGLAVLGEAALETRGRCHSHR